jgi:hypothetical protein
LNGRRAIKSFFRKLNDVMSHAALPELGIDMTEDVKSAEDLGLQEPGMFGVFRALPDALQKVERFPKAMGNRGYRPMIVSTGITNCVTRKLRSMGTLAVSPVN